MVGGLIQLAAYGAQDIYLTSNSQITFFKTVYRRATHFAMESINQLIDGNINFGGNITMVIGRNGDLLGRIFLQFKLFDITPYIQGEYTYAGWIQGVGNYFVKNASIEIGGQEIDSQYGSWMDIWSELSLPSSLLDGYGKMVGKNFNQANWQPYEPDEYSTLFVPLQFWFCRNPGLALPLVALQYHEIRLRISIANFSELITTIRGDQYVEPEFSDFVPNLNNSNLQVWCTYYFLDTTERRQFVQNPHEYLIEQIRGHSGDIKKLSSENLLRLNLNHPTKEIVFVFNRNNSHAPQNDFSMGFNTIPNGTPEQFAPLGEFKLVLNSGDRFKERPGEYFRVVQPYEHHTRTPSNYIYVYSFALRPEEHQPSGTCNFSRIDTAQLLFTLRTSQGLEEYNSNPSYTLYAPGYNILRIMSGMGGLAYSN